MRHLWRIVSVIVIAATAAVWFSLLREEWRPEIGLTYSDSYAAYLELPEEAYVDILDTLQPKHVRLPVEWDHVEEVRDVRDFSMLTTHLDAAAARNIPVTIAVGLKVPRYPECHIPAWAMTLSPEERDEALFAYLEATLTTLGTHPAVDAIQIENEPWFPFGECPMPDVSRFEREIVLARTLVPGKPIQTTVSGEQDLWVLRGQGIDRLGASLYRMAWSPTIGPAVFFYPARFYVYQALMTELSGVDATFSEVQAEPWIAKPWQIDDQRRYSAWDLRTTMLFTRLVGVRKIDLWGVEWWYHGREQGWGNEVWAEAERIFRVE